MNHLLLTFLILSTFVISSSAENWPHFGGPNGNNTSSETGLIKKFPEEGPKISWTNKIGQGFGGVAVRENEVYILDRNLGEEDIIRCFDLNSGKENWKFSNDVPGRMSYPGSRSIPTIDETHVFAVSGFGHVYCLDRKSHEVVWTFDIKKKYKSDPPKWGFNTGPILYKNTVIITPMSNNVGVVALNKTTGKEVWRTKAMGNSHSTPCLIEMNGQPQLIFMAGEAQSRGSQNNSTIYAFNPDDGKLLWEFKGFVPRRTIPYPIKVDDNKLFITGGYDNGSLLLEIHQQNDKVEFKEIWRTKLGSQIHIAIHDGDFIYLMANENSNQNGTRLKNGGLTCIDLKSGKEMWRTGDSPNFGRGNFIKTDNMLICQDGRSGFLRLVDLNPKEYSQLSEASIFGFSAEEKKDHKMWGPMALSDGRLLMRSQSELKCIDLRATKTAKK